MHAERQRTTSRRRAALAWLGALATALCLVALVGHGSTASPTLAAAAGGATPISDEQAVPPTMTPTLMPTSTPTATTTPADPIVITALDPRLALIPSATTTARFRVANTGAVPVAVVVTAACSRPEWRVGPIVLDDGSAIAHPVQLAAGQSVVVQLVIAVPAEARLDEHATVRVLTDIVG